MAKQNSNDKDIALSYQYMEIYFQAAVSINAIPFHYDRGNRHFRLDRSGYKYKLWFVQMVLGMAAETIQVTQELIRGSMDPNMSRGQWSLVLFIFITWVFVFVIHLTVYCYGEDIVSYINQVLGMRKYIQERNLPPTNDHNVVKAHICVSCVQYFFLPLMIAAEGTKAQYLFSNVPEAYRTPAVWTMWVPYAYYRVMSNILAGYFQYFLGAFHVQTCKQILLYRRQQTWEEGMRTYRMVQILCKRFNFVFANTFVPNITVMAAGNIILGNFGTLRFFNELEFSQYVNFPLISCMMLLFTITFYPSNATLKELSDWEQIHILISRLKIEKGLDTWDKESLPRIINVEGNNNVRHLLLPGQQGTKDEDHRQIRRFGETFRNSMDHHQQQRYKMAQTLARSCPFVAVRMAGFYPIKRTTALSIFDFIWCNTISTLLTWR